MALALAVTFVVSALAPLGAQGPVRERPAAMPVLTSNPVLRASLDRIGARSPSWRVGLEALHATGRHVQLLAPHEAPVRGPAGRAGDGAAWVAEAFPVGGGSDESVASFVVVVNLPFIDTVHARRGSLPAEFEADLDVIVVHEVYGHALPYLLAGNETGRCLDPTAGQRPTEACSIRRENVVRAELGLGRRTDYGLTGLLLARR